MMNADELALLCSALSVGELERPVRTLDTNLVNIGTRRLSLCLVGKILTTRLVNRAAFNDVMTTVWRVSEGVEIEWAEGNIFVLNFNNLDDRYRILAGGLWNFDRVVIAFEKPTGVGNILSMNFNRVEFWVQIHNLPLLCMTEDIGIFLGKMIGEVSDIDLESCREGNGRFIRVRVVLAANEPLLRCLRVDLLRTGEITTMLLRYERLLDFCFKCSRLGHSLRKCTFAGDVNEATSEANVRLNVWMRAVSPIKRFPGRSRGFNQGRSGDGWRGNNLAMEEEGTGGQWRSTNQGKEEAEGSKGVPRVVKSGGALTIGNKIQKEFTVKGGNQGKEDCVASVIPDTRIYNDEMVKNTEPSLVSGSNPTGPQNGSSFISEPICLDNVGGSDKGLGLCPVPLPTKPTPIKSQKLVKWKRITREKN
ncbi:hypothetical protein EZV62_024934 [Acer yangbiense]|uniref:CCHC-type domain-containing protein n=1 Tax=Acer yangbiense TaxID=1000413 RepID=A0A5C7GX11_9ROSI|nr:hypothetical protein EZV62_024934 [Acer yangbiense]